MPSSETPHSEDGNIKIQEDNQTSAQSQDRDGSDMAVSSFPTQDVNCSSLPEQDSLEDTKPWGRIISYNGSSIAFDFLENDEYTFGRGDDCDFCFNTNAAIRHSQYFTTYSKIHFKITKELFKEDQYHLILTDLSSNGTVLNGEVVGKNKQSFIQNGDIIALSTKSNKVFIFMDPNCQDDQNLPYDFRTKYRLSQVLGRGACGEVRLALHKETNRKFAVKLIEKRKFTARGKNQMNLSQSIKNEVNILKSLNHPCIIGIEDVIDSDSAVYIVLELIEGGELFDHVAAGAFEEPVAKLLFYQMLIAIKYLHDLKITHRDLKPENVLLQSKPPNTLIKITDFGLSKFVDGCEMMKTFCGTPNYLAPEILKTQGSGAYTNAVDCWSLGVILFICLGGYPPFTDERKDLPLAQQILEASYSFPKKLWKNVSASAIDLIKQLLTVNPEERFTVDASLEHPWLKDAAMIAKANEIMFGASSSTGVKESAHSSCSTSRREHSEDFDDTSNSTSMDTSPRATSPQDTTVRKQVDNELERGTSGRILRKRVNEGPVEGTAKHRRN